jgi:hypothetical protein
MRRWSLLALASTVALGACAVAPPDGPSVAAMPAKGKSLEAFQQDDMACRQYASASGSPSAAAANSQFNSAALGTLLGAGLGAAIGAAAGNPGIGAAIGAGSGAIVGTASGADAAEVSGATAQQRYDVAYAQCMAARGNQVPPMTAAAYPAPVPVPPPAPAYVYAYPAPYYYSPYVVYGGYWHRWR